MKQVHQDKTSLYRGILLAFFLAEIVFSGCGSSKKVFSTRDKETQIIDNCVFRNDDIVYINKQVKEIQTKILDAIIKDTSTNAFVVHDYSYGYHPGVIERSYIFFKNIRTNTDSLYFLIDFLLPVKNEYIINTSVYKFSLPNYNKLYTQLLEYALKSNADIEDKKKLPPPKTYTSSSTGYKVFFIDANNSRTLEVSRDIFKVEAFASMKYWVDQVPQKVKPCFCYE